jgi:transposase
MISFANTTTPSVFVGLDYHMNSVQLCVLDQHGTVVCNQRVDNDWGTIARVAGRHGPVMRAAIESCAGAADLAEQLVSLAGWHVDLAHPGYVNRMKQNPDKTDYSDARMLADLTRVGYLPRVWLAPMVIRELRKLVRFRQQLVDERKNTKLRLTALLREHRMSTPTEIGNRWTKRWMQWLADLDLGEHSTWIVQRHLERLKTLALEIRQVEQRLQDVSADDPVVQKLRGFSGIGAVTSWVMRAAIGRFDRFRNGKQLSRFCGVSPRNDSSGDKQADAGLIKASDELLRRTLVEAGHRLARHDPRYIKLAMKLRRKGKPICLIVAAIVNRWMRWLFHQMKEVAMIDQAIAPTPGASLLQTG